MKPVMRVITVHEVSACGNCPYIRNTAQNWSDPFTSAPAGLDYCGAGHGARLYITDKGVIDKDCPLAKQPRKARAKKETKR